VRYGLTFARRKLRELWLWISWRSDVARSHLREVNARVWSRPIVHTTRKILSAFCAEAAVLIAVFPYLDFLIENQHPPNGSVPIDMGPVKRLSAILCVACLVSAVILAVKAPDNEGDQEE
jgi:hypothetical protein